MKQIWICLLISLLALIYIRWENQQRAVARVVFCDVGQGDASYLRLPEGTDVLIDGGPNSQVTNCLHQELPYFDRTIEMAFITHPEKDHYGGFFALLKHYRVANLYLPETMNRPELAKETWGELLRLAREHQTHITYLRRGNTLVLKDSLFTVLAPNNNSLVLGASTPAPDLDFNNMGLVLSLRVKNQNLLFLADLDALPAEAALEQSATRYQILKVNHHGSRYGLSAKILSLAQPEVAVLSVGKNNLYGHPHPLVLELLRSHKIPLHRTDLEGKIEIVL
jgi:competence protein ComEC